MRELQMIVSALHLTPDRNHWRRRAAAALAALAIVVGAGSPSAPAGLAQPACDPSQPAGCPITLGQGVSASFGSTWTTHTWLLDVPEAMDLEVDLRDLALPLHLAVSPVGGTPLAVVERDDTTERVLRVPVEAGSYRIEIADPVKQTHAAAYQLLAWNMAQPLDGPNAEAAPPATDPAAPVAAAPATPAPAPAPGGGPNCTPVVVGTEIVNGAIVGETTVFPAGAAQFAAQTKCTGLRAGMHWGHVWQYYSQTLWDHSDRGVWDGGADGWLGTTVKPHRAGGAMGGSYTVIFLVDGVEVARGRFRVN